jgi:hypothetical protein
MRLYAGQIAAIAAEVVRSLLASKDIEASSARDVEADVSAVLHQYLADERSVNERAKDVLERTGKSQGDYSRVRALVADEKGIKVGDDAIDYLLDQVVQMLMSSNHVEEVFVEDIELRRKMSPIFKKHMSADSSVDADVRAQLRHLHEGTREWEIEYERVLTQVKRRKGL